MKITKIMDGLTCFCDYNPIINGTNVTIPRAKFPKPQFKNGYKIKKRPICI